MRRDRVRSTPGRDLINQRTGPPDDPQAFLRPRSAHRNEAEMTTPKHSTIKPKPRRDEMADLDTDMEGDDALDPHREQQLIKAWLAPQKGSQQQ
jgi:hypothetical protein